MSHAFSALGTPMRLAVRGGYMHRFDDVGVSAGFVGAPTSATPFVTRAFLDRDTGTVDANLTGSLGRGISARVSYGGEFGKRTTYHSLMGSVIASF